MARESDFIDKLSDFTKSLDNLVELLKEQQKIGPTEVVNQLLENIDGEAIASIVANIEEVKQNTVQINKNVDKILEVVKEQKKAKETGMFGEIDNKKNKSTITDGVKTVILIAAGVLAIGTAFKIVGSVDFFSVVALGLGIVFVAKAFATVASIKDGDGKPITYKRALLVSLMLITMSASVMIAGILLKKMPVLGAMELLTIVGVGLSMGLATFFLLKAVSKLKISSLKMAPFIPLLIPLIAAGIVGAGFILTQMPIVPLSNILSALGVGIALVPIVVAFGFLAKGLKNAKMNDIVMSAAAIPLIALGIVGASWALQLVADIDLVKTIKAGLGVGLAILAMVPTIYILQKAGLLNPASLKDLAIGALAIPLIATAITLASWVLSIGTYGNHPSLEWTLSVGLAILIFSLPVTIIGALMMASGGVGYAALAMGLLAVPLIALSMVAVSYILPLGNYSSFPPLEWTASVGLALILFSGSVLVLGIIAITGVGLLALGFGILASMLIAQTIVAVSHILPKGNYSDYPPLGWTASVGLAMILFSGPILALGMIAITGVGLLALGFGILASMLIAQSIVAISHILPNGTYTYYPSLKWTASVGLAMWIFGAPMLALGIMAMTGVGLVALGFGILAAMLIAEAIVAISHVLPGGDYTGNYPSSDWTASVGFAMATFAIPMLTLGMLAITGIGLVAIIMGLGLTALLATSIVGISHIFPQGDYSNNYPAADWTKNVGFIMASFAVPMLVLGMMALNPVGLAAILLGLGVTILIAGTIVLVSHKLKSGSYSKHPSTDWSEGVAISLSSFASSASSLFKKVNNPVKALKFGIGLGAILTVAYTIAEVSNALAKGTYKNSITKDWSEGVALALTTFIGGVGKGISTLQALKILAIINMIVTASEELSKMSKVDSFDNVDKIAKSISSIMEVIPNKAEIDPIWDLIDALNALSNISWGDMLSIHIIGASIGYLSKQIEKINDKKVDSLAKLGVGLQIISLVDEEKLKSTLDAIEAKTTALKEITDEGSMIRGIFDHIAVKYYDGNSGGGGSFEETKVKPKTEKSETFEEQLLQHVKNIDTNISKMSDVEEEERQEKLEGKDVDDPGWLW